MTLPEMPQTKSYLPLLHWHRLADRVIAGEVLPRQEAFHILEADDDQILDILSAGFKIRKAFFGKKMRLNMLINAKSGFCPEDCGYCSQSSRSTAPIVRYPFVSKETLLKGAAYAHELKASTYCIVASGRGPTEKELDQVAEAVRAIKARYNMKICACLGLLKEGQAEKLKEAGVDRYNHNLNTSAAHHPKIVTTHRYEDRVDTLEKVKASRLSPCAGLIVGMGENEDDILDLAYALRELGAESIPVNFLHPVEGTPLEDMGKNHPLTPLYCLKVLAMFRFVNPTAEIRVAGGRELHLKTLQPLALYVANSIFIGDYLTTKGQEPKQDYQMIEDLGFSIE